MVTDRNKSGKLADVFLLNVAVLVLVHFSLVLS